MAILTLQIRGLLFILLLAGNEIATVSAMRTRAGPALDIAEMAQEPGKEDSSVPTSSSECHMSGHLGKAKCQPERYCEFGRRWSNLGGLLRDKSCRLKMRYESDEKLATKFGIASGKLILKSEEFRTSGSILHVGKLTEYYQDLGTCANAATSDKTSLNRLMTAFREEQIQEYATSVGGMASKISGLNKFNIDGLSAEALNVKALERTVQSLDLGFKKSRLMRTIATKVNLMELMKVNALTDAYADQATIVKKVLPGLSQAQLDTVLSEANAKTDAELQECNNDDECMKGRTEAHMEAMSDNLSEVDEENVNALLQHAESQGLTQARQDEDHHDRRSRAFSFLEEHMEHVEGEPSEHVEGEPSEHVEGEPSEHDIVEHELSKEERARERARRREDAAECLQEVAGFVFLALVFVVIAVVVPIVLAFSIAGAVVFALFFGVAALISSMPSVYIFEQCVRELFKKQEPGPAQLNAKQEPGPAQEEPGGTATPSIPAVEGQAIFARI